MINRETAAKFGFETIAGDEVFFKGNIFKVKELTGTRIFIESIHTGEVLYLVGLVKNVYISKFSWRSPANGQAINYDLIKDKESIEFFDKSLIPLISNKEIDYNKLPWRPSMKWLLENGGGKVTESDNQDPPFELQDIKRYIDKGIVGEEPVFTEEMFENGDLPPVGSMVLFSENNDIDYLERFNGLNVKVVGINYVNGEAVITFHNELRGIGCIIHHKGAYALLFPKKTQQEIEVDEMFKCSAPTMRESEVIRQVFIDLYKAGYRK